MGKILVLDDEMHINDITRFYLTHVLNFPESHVLTVTSSSTAFEYLQTEPIDLIIQDNMRPTLSGVQFIKILKANPQFRTVSIMMLSARFWETFCEEMKEYELDPEQDILSYTHKPFSPSKLGIQVLKNLYKTGKEIPAMPRQAIEEPLTVLQNSDDKTQKFVAVKYLTEAEQHRHWPLLRSLYSNDDDQLNSEIIEIAVNLKATDFLKQIFHKITNSWLLPDVCKVLAESGEDQNSLLSLIRQHPDQSLQLKAMAALKYSSPEMITLLEPFLNSAEQGDQWNIIEILSYIDHPRAKKILRQFMTDSPFSNCRHLARKALFYFDKKKVMLILAGLKGNDPEKKQAARSKISTISPKDGFEYLKMSLEDDPGLAEIWMVGEFKTFHNVMIELERLTADSSEPFIYSQNSQPLNYLKIFLQAKSSWLRDEAIKCLPQFGADGIRLLYLLLKSDDKADQRMAIRVLVENSSEKAILMLKRTLRSAAASYLKILIITEIDALGKSELLPLLAPMLRKNDPLFQEEPLLKYQFLGVPITKEDVARLLDEGRLFDSRYNIGYKDSFFERIAEIYPELAPSHKIQFIDAYLEKYAELLATNSWNSWEFKELSRIFDPTLLTTIYDDILAHPENYEQSEIWKLLPPVETKYAYKIIARALPINKAFELIEHKLEVLKLTLSSDLT